jgi:hypothetical protein
MSTVQQITPQRPQETLASRLRREFADFDPVVRLAGLAVKLEAVAFDDVITAADNMPRQVLVNDVAAQLAVAAYAKVATYLHPVAVTGPNDQAGGVNPHAAEASRRLIERIDRLTDAVRGGGGTLAELAGQCEKAADRAAR